MTFELTNSGQWMLASALVAIAATNLAWLGTRFARGSSPARNNAVAPLAWLIVSLFYGLPPIFAWRAGALSPYLAGFTELDWARSLTWGIFLVLLTVSVVSAGWVFGVRGGRVHRRGADPASAARLPVWRAPVDAALLQLHWTFYRACAAGALVVMGERLTAPPAPGLAAAGRALSEAPLYWGSWLGMAVIGVEWALNPFARQRLRDPSARPYVLLRIALAVATTALFVATRNFWLALLAHGAAELAVAAWLPAPQGDLAYLETPNSVE